MGIVRGGIVRSRPDFVRSIVFSNGTPPLPLSASVLTDGVTLRIVFDQAILTGSATAGLTRSTGSITSGTYSGVNLDLVIPKVYQGDSVGTVSYAPGTLAGASGAVAAFGPLSITNNSTQQSYNPNAEYSDTNYGNFWHLATSAVYEDVGGTTPAEDNGDVVGCVARLRNTPGAAANRLGKDLAQSTTASKPTLVTSGGTYAKELKINGAQSLWTNIFGSPGTQMANVNFTTSAWTIAFRARGTQTTSGYIVFGADTDPRAGARIIRSGSNPQDNDVEVAVLNVRTYDSLPNPTSWHTIVLTKASGSGGQVNLYVDDMTTPVVTYNDDSGSYADNRVAIAGVATTSDARLRSALFIDKVITDRAGLKEWLEA